ncbi:hypothetical protein [Dyella sp.]|uniref:hypothetical protein n=1 Tax=Dyella sp. TaxID=1869338 RepID=UPI003F812A5F
MKVPTQSVQGADAPSFPRKREVLFNGECRSSTFRFCPKAKWMPAFAGMTPRISDTSAGTATMDSGCRNYS